MTRQPNELKKRSGAELRAAAAERAAAAVDPAEQARRVLAAHERVIEGAVRKFVDMGRSLLAIRSERLYSGEYSTFAEYCEARWEISETYANRVISASLVAIKATPIGVEINSEAVARELADLADKPEQMRQVWDEATRRVAGGRITAALIKEVRKSLDPPPAAALEGEVVDNNETGPKDDASDSGAPGPAAGVDVADPSAPAAPQDHPVAIPGDAEDEGPEGGESSGVDGAGTPSTQTGSEGVALPPASGLVDGRQQQGSTGVSGPAAAGPDDDEQRILDWRRGVSRDFMRALADARLRLHPDPIAWLENVYLPNSFPDRDMPRVRDCFSSDAIRTTAQYLFEVAEYMDMKGFEL